MTKANKLKIFFTLIFSGVYAAVYYIAGGKDSDFITITLAYILIALSHFAVLEHIDKTYPN